jgi:hypothetical protein
MTTDILPCKILIHYSKEQVGNYTIGVRWELVVFDAVGMDAVISGGLIQDSRQFRVGG